MFDVLNTVSLNLLLLKLVKGKREQFIFVYLGQRENSRMNFCLVDVHDFDEYDFPNQIIDLFL